MIVLPFSPFELFSLTLTALLIYITWKNPRNTKK